MMTHSQLMSIGAGGIAVLHIIDGEVPKISTQNGETDVPGLDPGAIALEGVKQFYLIASFTDNKITGDHLLLIHDLIAVSVDDRPKLLLFQQESAGQRLSRLSIRNTKTVQLGRLYTSTPDNRHYIELVSQNLPYTVSGLVETQHVSINKDQWVFKITRTKLPDVYHLSRGDFTDTVVALIPDIAVSKAVKAFWSSTDPEGCAIQVACIWEEVRKKWIPSERVEIVN